MTSTQPTIESIVKQWTSFDLKSIQDDLDVPTTEIVSRTDESDQSRRKLVELSRDFKQNTTEDVRRAITLLLKSFQIELASLSNAFADISPHFIELPDSVLALEYVRTLQRRIERVSDQISLHELADVNHRELAIKQLRDQIKDLEEKTEVIQQQHIKEKEDFQPIFTERNSLLNDAQMEMHSSPINHLHRDMFQYQKKQDEEQQPTTTMDFLEQVNERTVNADRLADQLREELEQETTHNSAELISEEETERKLREKLQLELVSKERQIATLVLETQKLQSTLIQIQDTSSTQISDLQTVLSSKEKLICQLESKLQSQADYEEIKRELTTFKSMDFPAANRSSNDDQLTNGKKQSFDSLLSEQSRPLANEQISVKASSTDLENNNNTNQPHSYLHCTSPCLHRTNPPFLPIPSLLSSSASSSSNSSSSPSSPTPTYLKPHLQSLTNGTTDEEMPRSINESSKLPPSSLSIITTKDNLQLCNSLSNSTNANYPSIASACSTMVTPTASLLSSVTTTTITPSTLFPAHQLSSVQCTKLRCPPPSSWSPPLSSSSGVSSIATTSTDNRTVIKSSSSKAMSPKPSPSSTILVPSISTNNNLLEPLDTTYVANVVRKLLAQHNIGQRIFARYILSLSQGTVSELLSKPKDWAKLTEKGKESYRKMWCWANSEESIVTLKSISPRKGMNNRSKDNPYPAVSTKHTDPATHQKIVQILADAQKQQMAAAIAAAASANSDPKSSLSPCSSLPIDSSNLLSSSDLHESKTSSSSSSSSTVNSPLNESMSLEHSSFLHPAPPPPPPSSSSAAAASFSMLSAFVPSLLMRTANGFNSETTTGNLMDCSTPSPFSLLCSQPNSYQNWLMLQEIVRNNDLLKQFQPNFPSTFDTDDEGDPENENDDDEDDENHEGVEDDDLESDDDDDVNEDNPTSSDEIPLDLSMKIDSTPSDMEQPSLRVSNHKHQSSTKHVKTALTPLRDQDTSKYRYINTAELVQTVKDILSRYSISQRHFGEKILGLSQGSVSDILARPKQWELLTQKGREPFLRMRIFLDDPNAIKHLIQTVATNPTATSAPTTIATSTSSILLPTFCPPLSLSSTPSLLSNVKLNGYHSNTLLTRDNANDLHINETVSQILTNDSIQSVPLPSSSTISSSSPLNGTSTTSISRSKSRSKSAKTGNEKPTSSSRQSSSLMAPYELPKITLPSTIDTEQLSSQVRELLFAYSIGQRVFGEAVLNLSQGTVSEILSKPRPWHSLSVKGREPYIRMYTWFNDANNVQKLLVWKRERDALRRSRPPPAALNSTSSSLNDNGDPDSGNNGTSSTKISRPKRRYLFTDDQRRALKQIFDNEPYPSQSILEQLVTDLDLPMNKIANWFHNSRMRTKSNIRPLTSPTNPMSTSIVHNTEDLINAQTDDEEDLEDINNNNNNNNDEDDDDEDDYHSLPTIVPLTSSWLNGTNDSNSSTSPIAFSSTPTNIVSLIDDQKIVPVSSSLSSSSKKRKSVPQKIVTTSTTLNPMAKKFHSNPTMIENDSNDQTTNESANFVDILT